MSAVAVPQRDARRLWLAALRGSEPAGAFFELRGKRPGGSLQRLAFRPVDGDLSLLSASIEQSAQTGDVYVGLAPRREVYRLRDRKRSGGIDAIQRVHVLWVDADTPEACAALRAFQPAASILIASGNGLHGYWSLCRPVPPAAAKRACRRLALRIRADMNATDAARIMRPPGTLNWKSPEPKPVLCEQLEATTYTCRQLVGSLPDPPIRRSPQAPQATGPASASALIAGASRIVREATPGNRNAALNWAAYSLGKRISAGELDERSVRDELRNAAEAAGLPEPEIDGTLASGLSAGLAAV
ncbi:MAG TPA: hypothetical protein VG188_05300 [Solirubrobacteraceae bacterium]|jgi:hypothetical protein|nr:hypothetical protein [Solirubrobacteraceae bacterium]